MKEYIEREAVCKNCNNLNICTKDSKCPVIRTAAADVVERKRGEWVEHDRYICNSDDEPVAKIGSVFVCSECGRQEQHKEPFCHCGADMSEVDHDPEA